MFNFIKSIFKKNNYDKSDNILVNIPVLDMYIYKNNNNERLNKKIIEYLLNVENIKNYLADGIDKEINHIHIDIFEYGNCWNLMYRNKK